MLCIGKTSVEKGGGAFANKVVDIWLQKEQEIP